MPLPDAPDYSQRIYELLKETDLENLSYSQFQNVANKIFIEPENEDEMRRLVLVQLARMAVRGDWDGFLTGGSSGGSIGGSISDNQIAVGATAANTIEGSANLTFDGSILSVLNQLDIGGVGAAGIVKNSNTNQDLELRVLGTGNVRVKNETTNTDSQLNVQGNGSGTPKVSLSNDTKAVTLQCDTNQKLTVKGGTEEFVLDVSSATGGITFPDGTTQTTAASGGGGGAGYQAVLPTRDGSYPASNRELFLVSCMPPWGNTNSGSTSSTTASSSPYFRPFISPVTGTVTEIQVSVNAATDTPDYILGIYSDSGGLPNTKIAEGTVSIVTTGTLALSTFTGTPALTAGTQYHFAWVRKDTTGAGNFTAESASSCFKYASVSQTYPNLASVGTTGVVVSLSGSNNALPATVSTGNLSPFSNNPIRFGLRWD